MALPFSCCCLLVAFAGVSLPDPRHRRLPHQSLRAGIKSDISFHLKSEMTVHLLKTFSTPNLHILNPFLHKFKISLSQILHKHEISLFFTFHLLKFHASFCTFSIFFAIPFFSNCSCSTALCNNNIFQNHN